ncbi:UvrD-helicase domain-containing protein [Winogradskyella sp.]|uniref:UvrD-helicase domain-containing protein n=1 Tax=Winogradskyella sp. TaxID=1883156 RepID=UPI001B180410|nr:UvrD-helicase domain-containing protein [Winogradskyella sp.]MBO6879394.1 UvrD-helicase domain-containing protein [Winogradskyella sp.]
MSNSPFKIYNASAGSGKTFTLAKSYIKILVQSQNYDQFKSILAITFTNKAVGEMKERIIEMLKLFSQEKSLREPHPMFIAICEELSISAENLHNKSKHILKHIIHNYGAFDISTIDGFTHRVIRTFAHDLKLPVNFEVELDQERLLNEAVDSLIAKAGTDKALTKVLVDFAIEKADDDKSWDISYDFNKIAKLLVSENDLPAIETLKDKAIADFKILKSSLSQEITKLEVDILIIAETTLALIDECGLQFDDFSRKSLPNYFENLSSRNFNVSFDSTWQSDLTEGNTLYPKRVSETIASTIESIQPDLAEAFLKTKALIIELKLKKGFYKNITPLSVLNAIQNELNMLKEEQNKLLISEFNKIISNEIKDQPTPFIYERLGEKFKHYFIDEFQDTSKMQWRNLTSLLDSSLSTSNGSVMLVGDAKQAIYRWRGGEAEQFIDLYNKIENPFQVEAQVLTLDTNYRSAKEIINFNNGFFKFLSENYFSDKRYAELYENSNQNLNNDIEGYVNIEFLDISKDDDATNLYASQVLNRIKECQNNGYSLNDICIIVRKRKEGVAIANHLSENGIEITSSETLLLKNSDKVNFLDSFLRLLLQPNNDSLKIEILSFIAEQHSINDKHLFFETHLKPSIEELFLSLKSLDIFLEKNELLRMSLYELVEQLIRTFNLHNSSDAYLMFYLDVVLEFTQKQNSDLAAFIDYFDKKKDSLSVVSPKNMNAVQVMTIHKSKGLEFPVVIFPFADLNIYRELDPKTWFPVEENDYNGFETLLLNYNKDTEHFGEIGQLIYNTHQSQLELDNLNLLYVTLTRAVEQLYVISKKDINNKDVVAENTYAGMFISYLQTLGKWSDNQSTYSFGSLINNQERPGSEDKNEPLRLISVPKEDHNLNIITKSGQLWDTKQERAMERGNLVHLILSKIKTSQDVDFAINDLVVSGDILSSEEKELRDLVMEVIQHQKLSPYFTSEFEIYNERDIITNTGQILRPDRINIHSNNEAIIIDYKTGEQKTSYKSQLNSYASILEVMNYSIKHKYIVYINDAVEVIEV